MSSESLSDTGEFPAAPRPEARPWREPISVDLAGQTHIGKVRRNNEDNFHVFQFGRYLRTRMSSLPAGLVAEETDHPGYGFVVADGVAGNAGGEVASRMAIAMLIECILQTPDWILGHEEHQLAKVHERTAGRFQAVNEAVVTHSESTPELRGMGTTLSLALTLGDDLLVSHVGDSPVCLFRSGRLHRLTRDHSESRRYPDENAASVARFRRVLTRAIGMPKTGGEPDIFHYKLADGDRLLLCSDGLTDMVEDELIVRELGKDKSAADTCQSLIELSLDHGGRDNATVVLAAYRFPDGSETR